MSNRRRPAAETVAELLPPEATAEKITGFFRSLGDDADVTVSVYAIDPKDRIKGRSFLFELQSVAELTGPALMAQVLEKYGPGEYLAEGRAADGTLQFCPRFHVGPIRSARAEIPDPRPSPTAASSAPPELVAMLERNTRALEALAAQPRPSMIDMVRELAAVRELFAPAPAPAAPAFDFGKMIELVKQVLDLRDTLGTDGPAATDGPLGILARSLAPALTKIAERAVEQPPALPNPTSTAAAPNLQPTAAAEGEDVNGVMLKAYVTQLVRFAEQNTPPQDAAARVLQTLAGFPEPMVEAVYNWLNDEAVIDNLAALDPRAASYRDWLEKVVDAVLDALSEPEESPPAAAPTSANGAQQPTAR